MSIHINPGTGPIGSPTSTTDSWINMVELVRDAGVIDKLDMPRAIVQTSDGIPEGGRVTYEVKLGERVCEVEMPALPLTLVRHVPGETNIWDFPRLYVDGSSWVWPYAAEMVFESLCGEREEENA